MLDHVAAEAGELAAETIGPMMLGATIWDRSGSVERLGTAPALGDLQDGSSHKNNDSDGDPLGPNAGEMRPVGKSANHDRETDQVQKVRWHT